MIFFDGHSLVNDGRMHQTWKMNARKTALVMFEKVITSLTEYTVTDCANYICIAMYYFCCCDITLKIRKIVICK